MLTLAVSHADLVSDMYMGAHAALDVDKQSILLANSSVIIEIPRVRKFVLDQLRSSSPQVVAGAVMALRYRVEYHPLLLRAVTDRLGSEPREIEYFISPLDSLTTQVAPGPERTQFVKAVPPYVLAGLKVAESKALTDTLWYLRHNEAHTPEVLEALRSLLMRPELSESLRLHAATAMRALFPEESNAD